MFRKKGTRALTSDMLLNFCLKSKRSQIAQTINWVVATLIIVVVLTISFFMANGGLLKSGRWDLNDKQKDFVATKSIVNFVGANENLIISSVENGDYVEFDKKFKPFLESLFAEVCEDYCGYRGVWQLGGEHAVRIVNLDANIEKYDEDAYHVEFVFLVNGEQKELIFWENLIWE